MASAQTSILGGRQPRYILGHDRDELDRLIDQARFFGDLTEEVLRRAGVEPGMRVLDVGCGTGDVRSWPPGWSGRPARCSASTGRRGGRVAERRARDAGLGNVSFVVQELSEVTVTARSTPWWARLRLPGPDHPHPSPAHGAYRGGHRRRGRGPLPPRHGLGAKTIREDAETSLRQLGTDRLELDDAHIDDRSTPQEETVEAWPSWPRPARSGCWGQQPRHLADRAGPGHRPGPGTGPPTTACSRSKLPACPPRPGPAGDLRPPDQPRARRSAGCPGRGRDRAGRDPEPGGAGLAHGRPAADHPGRGDQHRRPARRAPGRRRAALDDDVRGHLDMASRHTDD
jgi:hypothetical protein